MPTNPMRLDPTRTTMERKALIAEMGRRCSKLRKAIWQLVVEEDAFGIEADARAAAQGAGQTALAATTHTIPLGMVLNTRWRFETDDKKVGAYQEWLKQEVKAGLLEVDAANQDTPWLAKNIRGVYKKGALRAYNDAHKADGGDKLDFIEGGKAQFMKDAFEGPVAESKIRGLYTRSFTQLKGVTAQMDADMSRTLSQGLAQGNGARAIARNLQKNVTGLEKRRARAIARTEIVHAHNEGQLDSFEAMNMEGVGVMAEWSTAHDGMVCPLCAPMEGVVLTIKEARGMLPRHPNCITGDMRVVAPEAVALLKTYYTGEIIELITVRGRRITVTPAHILLTEYGFVRAEAIYHGLNLVVDTGLYGGFEAPDYENDVSTIAEEFVTATETPGRRPVSVPTAPEHLHNEGRFCNKEIDIILADSILGKERQTYLGKPCTHGTLPFCSGGVGRLALGTFAQILFRAAHTSDGSMGTCRDALAFLLGAVLEAEQVCLGAITGTLPNIGQALPDDITVNTKMLRHCLDRHPILKKLHNFFGGDLGAILTGSVHDLATRLIEAGFDGIPFDAVMFGDTVEGPPVVSVQYDKVLSVRKFHVVSLPVYDIQTRSTAYSVEGIITSNCRCAWIPGNVGEEDGGTTTTTWAGDEQGLEAPGTLPTGKTTGQVWSKDVQKARILESIKAEFPKLDAAAARKASKWVGADASITGKIKPGSKAAQAAQAAVDATKVAAEAIVATRAAQAAQKAETAVAKRAAGKAQVVEVELNLPPDPGPMGWQDTKHLPMALGSNFNDLKIKGYRDFLRDAAKKSKQEVMPEFAALYKYASDPSFMLKKKERVFFGLKGTQFSEMGVGDTFDSLGARSTTWDKKRAFDYAGGDGQVFEVVLPEGTHGVYAKVFDIEELVLLPGSRFEVVEMVGNVKRVKLVTDGSDYIKELKTFQDELDAIYNKAQAAIVQEAAEKAAQAAAEAKLAQEAAQAADKVAVFDVLVKKYKLEDIQIATFDGDPRLEVAGLSEYMEKTGVELTEDEQARVLFLLPRSGQTTLAAQLEKLDEVVAIKATQEAELAAARAVEEAFKGVDDVVTVVKQTKTPSGEVLPPRSKQPLPKEVTIILDLEQEVLVKSRKLNFGGMPYEKSSQIQAELVEARAKRDAAYEALWTARRAGEVPLPETALPEMLDEVVGLRVAATMSTGSAADFDAWVETAHGGMSVAEVSTKLQKVVDEADVMMGIKTVNLKKVLADGEFKNSLQTGKGTFKTIGEKRALEERAFLGMTAPFDEAEQYPKYGFLTKPGMHSDPMLDFGYGGTFVKFKRQNITERTTVTFGDSYNNNVGAIGTPARLDAVDHRVLTRYASRGVKADSEHARAMAQAGDIDEYGFGEYVEAQIYGKLGIEDIEAVYTSSKKEKKVLEAALKKAGLKDVPVLAMDKDPRLKKLASGSYDDETQRLLYSLTPDDIDRLGDVYIESNDLPSTLWTWQNKHKYKFPDDIAEMVAKYDPNNRANFSTADKRELLKRFYRRVPDQEKSGLPEVFYEDYRASLANWTDDVINKDALKGIT